MKRRYEFCHLNVSCINEIPLSCIKLCLPKNNVRNFARKWINIHANKYIKKKRRNYFDKHGEKHILRKSHDG